ncbi:MULTISPECIES: Crp/Fnr family transcriptional regulator [Saccharothrix]|uniref:Crp/Fnr family transcriptional regulator n=1 Tax=Saccharothrix yanglingensis TaxID=659496 RepID=A0ABU0WUT7_9PSEU|nr:MULTISPECIES: Crp/Fnr family transcriptional regulator [Saccharothrix]MDQ2583618.1 Crp/Fnr family transcriptional regulator [Saccharothrix yanglingensis]
MRSSRNTVERSANGISSYIRTNCAGAARIVVEKDESIYSVGSRDSGVYLVESGQVKTVAYSRDGKRCLLSIHPEGDTFGELALFGPPRAESAMAMTRTVLRQVPASRLRQALSDDALLQDFIVKLGERVVEQQQMITNLLTMDSERRLAAILLHLAQKVGNRADCGYVVEIRDRITQEDLSGMVGTTRSRVGYFLKRFRDAGLVESVPDSFLCINESRMTAFLEGCAC